MTDDLEEIFFDEKMIVREQGTSEIITVNSYDTIKDALSSISYKSSDSEIVSVNNTTGEITALKNGLATITATAITKGNKTLIATYDVDVLGHIDYTDENSLQGTYDIIFFGMNTNNTSLAKGVISNNCDMYPSFLWKTDTECGSGTAGCKIDDGKFAGKAVIRVVNSDKVLVHTKVGFIGKGLIVTISKDDQYQYTVYDEKTFSDWLNTGNTGSMNGRVLTKKSDEQQNATYYFEQNQNYSGKTNYDVVMYSNFQATKSGQKVDPQTRLILRKVSSQVKPMDHNTLDDLNITIDKFDSSNIYTAPSLD